MNAVSHILSPASFRSFRASFGGQRSSVPCSVCLSNAAGPWHKPSCSLSCFPSPLEFCSLTSPSRPSLVCISFSNQQRPTSISLSVDLPPLLPSLPVALGVVQVQSLYRGELALPVPRLSASEVLEILFRHLHIGMAHKARKPIDLAAAFEKHPRKRMAEGVRRDPYLLYPCPLLDAPYNLLDPVDGQRRACPIQKHLTYRG